MIIIRAQIFVSEHIDDMLPKTLNSISASDVCRILKEPKLNKSAELDSLAAKHYVYSHSSFTVHLAILFSCMLSHGYIPSSFVLLYLFFLKNIFQKLCTKNLNHDRPHCYWCLQEPLMMCSLYKVN